MGSCAFDKYFFYPIKIHLPRASETVLFFLYARFLGNRLTDFDQTLHDDRSPWEVVHLINTFFIQSKFTCPGQVEFQIYWSRDHISGTDRPFFFKLHRFILIPKYYLPHKPGLSMLKIHLPGASEIPNLLVPDPYLRNRLTNFYETS